VDELLLIDKDFEKVTEDDILGDSKLLTKDDFFVSNLKFNYGKNNQNPIERYPNFYFLFFFLNF
jgi:hypothetical protein